MVPSGVKTTAPRADESATPASATTDGGLSSTFISRSKALVAVMLATLAGGELPHRAAAAESIPAIAETNSITKATEPLAIGSLVPNFKFTDSTGVARELKDLRGSIVLLDFWATWCGPCISGMPELRALHSEMSSMQFNGAPGGFKLLSISIDDNADAVKWEKFLKRSQTPWMHARDVNESIRTNFSVHAIPAFFLLDGDGKLIGRYAGGEGSPHEGLLAIQTELKARLSPASAAKVVTAIEATVQTADYAKNPGQLREDVKAFVDSYNRASHLLSIGDADVAKHRVSIEKTLSDLFNAGNTLNENILASYPFARSAQANVLSRIDADGDGAITTNLLSFFSSSSTNAIGTIRLGDKAEQQLVWFGDRLSRFTHSTLKGVLEVGPASGCDPADMEKYDAWAKSLQRHQNIANSFMNLAQQIADRTAKVPTSSGPAQ